MAQTRTAWTCAEQAGHTGLHVWAQGTSALIAEWSPQSRLAVRLACRAAKSAPAGASRIRIAAIEARAAARIGDRERAAAALARLYTAREESPQLDDVAQFGGIFSFPLAKQEYYMGGTYALLGEHAAADRHAAAAIAAYERGPEDERSYGDEALARVDSALAPLAQGDVREAVRRLRPVVEIPVERRIQQFGSALARIEDMLKRPSFARNGSARELAEQIQGYELIDSVTSVEGEMAS
ncbi:hypothetical protein Ssi02_66240 [Sinosporangium siamense]|uniref:Uncharacterized protein n=2 Tax=Sinosporangium siamense TaxID=1367973 RepID=A0A919VAF8_9ACTN|nr:hypothetical protein Ssi02_66240 [Sinosporangium siamense]